MSSTFPNRIICMTEESVELLYALGLEDKIIGVSAYVKRPAEAKSKPTISVFTHANLKKILALKPDLVIGYSDIQKDIARDLIGEGLSVFISNHRSLEEVLGYCSMLGNMLGESKKTEALISNWEEKINEAREFAASLKIKPKVYIEEWPDPTITGIRYFSELVQLCGGEDVYASLNANSLAKDRIIQFDDVLEKNPDIILGCWCGKPVELDSFAKRTGWQNLNAVKSNQIFELEPEVFLQPGPALFEEGINQLIKLFKTWSN